MAVVECFDKSLFCCDVCPGLLADVVLHWLLFVVSEAVVAYFVHCLRDKLSVGVICLCCPGFGDVVHAVPIGGSVALVCKICFGCALFGVCVFEFDVDFGYKGVVVGIEACVHLAFGVCYHVSPSARCGNEVELSVCCGVVCVVSFRCLRLSESDKFSVGFVEPGVVNNHFVALRPCDKSLSVVFGLFVSVCF